MSSSEHRLWKKKSGGEGAVKKRSTPKLTEWRVKGAEKLAVAKAHLQERFSHMANWISYHLYTFTHPCNPLRRRAARRSKTQSNLGATERRIQKEAIARSKTADKRMAEDPDHARLLS